jgi:hypothetical protein
MEVEISEDVSKKVNEASRILGIGEQEIVDRALLVYLDNMNKYLQLKKEMEAWDVLSDEALENFEKSL